jgi:hypothetical protein
MNQRIAPKMKDHCELASSPSAPTPLPDLTFEGPMHFEPPLAQARSIVEAVCACTDDEAVRLDIAAMLLGREQVLTDKQRQYAHDKRVRDAAKAVAS